MAFSKASDYGYIAKHWHSTNGFVLGPIVDIYSPIPAVATVAVGGVLGKRELCYYTYFYIMTRPLGTNQTELVVRSFGSEVLDGREPGIHGGWAGHWRRVPPVRREEENVLAEISARLPSYK